MTHECLVALLGVRRDSISVAADALQKLGVIGYQQGAITVLDVERLEAVEREDYRLGLPGYEQMHG